MMRTLFHIVLCCTVSNSLFAQKLASKVSEKQLMIGQAITLTYSVKVELSDSILFMPKSGEIPARASDGSDALSREGVSFEVLDDFKDTFVVSNKTKEWIGQYVVTAWDSGVFILPGPTIIINDSTFNFQDLEVACYLVDPIDGMDIYDIKENFAELPPEPFSFVKFMKSNWWWLTIIAIGLTVFFVMRRRKDEDEEEEERPMSLKERTLLAIDALEKAKLWEKDQLKEHFVELSFILRSYLTSRYQLSLLEKTTYQSKLLLLQKGLNEETVELIARILSQSDMVKFAKSKPEVMEILKVSTLVRQIVAETSPLEFDNVE